MKNNINNILNFIANRFLFSKKSQTLVNVISLISTISLTFIMMLLVFIISIFNGFQNIIESQYSVFYPDIKITSENNFFNSEEFNLSNIKYINSSTYISILTTFHGIWNLSSGGMLGKIKKILSQALKLHY